MKESVPSCRFCLVEKGWQYIFSLYWDNKKEQFDTLRSLIILALDITSLVVIGDYMAEIKYWFHF